jgi:hypothetical protein
MKPKTEQEQTEITEEFFSVFLRFLSYLLFNSACPTKSLLKTDFSSGSHAISPTSAPNL